MTQNEMINGRMRGEKNEVSPTTWFQIYKTYVLPRLLYGLEILPLNKTNIATLEKFHKNSLRMIQSLPERTATAAVNLLLGALPVEQRSIRNSSHFCTPFWTPIITELKMFLIAKSQ